MARFISEKCKISPQNIRLLTDDRATTQAILERLNWLVDGAKPGDRIFSTIVDTVIKWQLETMQEKLTVWMK
jgi:hypothetical protein